MSLPPDIYPESGSRLPLVKREDLDGQGQSEFDALAARAGGASLAGLRGPGGLNLHSPKAAAYLNGLSRYLRYESGMSARVRETAILITALETDQQFEWAMHEPNALKEGVPQATVDAIKHGRATAGLDETDAVIVELGRQVFGTHKVDSELFARARKIFGDRGLVELVMLMGNYSAIAALLTTFDAKLAPGQQPALPPRE
jgi:4-carboxymuconolactone decarboxylase